MNKSFAVQPRHVTIQNGGLGETKTSFHYLQIQQQ